MKKEYKIIKIVWNIFHVICFLIIIGIVGITIYLSSTNKTNQYFHDAGPVACEITSDIYGIHIKDSMICKRMDGMDRNLYAIKVTNETNTHYVYITKNTSYNDILTSKHHIEDRIKTENISYRQHDLFIQYFAYDGTQGLDNGETAALSTIYAVFDYCIDDVHVYSDYIGVSTYLSGEVKDIKEGSYEHILQKQITDFLDEVIN